MLWLAALVACGGSSKLGSPAPGEDTADTADAAAPLPASASAGVGPAGGGVEIGGEGALLSIRADVPAGALAEEATLTLAWQAALPEDHPVLYGADRLGGLTLEVAPASAAEAALGAVELTFEVDPSALDAETRAGIGADAAGWIRDHLLLTGEGDSENDTLEEIAACDSTETGVGPAYELAIDSLLDREADVAWAGEGGSGSVSVRFKLLREGVGFPSRADVTQRSTAKQIWFTQRAIEVFPRYSGEAGAGESQADLDRRAVHADPHFGPIKGFYYPIGVGGEPALAWPEDEGQAERVSSCILTLVDAVSSQLTGRFAPVAVPMEAFGRATDSFYGTDEAVWNLAVYDFTAGTTNATTNYEQLLIRLPSAWLDPDLYGTNPGCLIRSAAEEIDAGSPRMVENHDKLGTLAHELFHLQMGAYLYPYAAETAPYRKKAEDQIFQKAAAWNLGGFVVEGAVTHRRNGWLIESLPTYFSYELVHTNEIHARYGLDAYALDSRPWIVIGGEIYPHEIWDYSKAPFFKFLFDREREGSDEMAELADLLAELGAANLQSAREGATPPAQGELLQGWMAGRGLTWFDFFREHALLRGCLSWEACSLARTGGKGAPFGVLPDGHGADLLGSPADAAYWTSTHPGSDLHGFDPLPWDEGAPEDYVNAAVYDGGASMTWRGCRADSVKDAYELLDSAASAILLKEMSYILGKHQLNYRTTGVRIDVVDDLPYDDADEAWRADWALRIGEDCPVTARWEVWRHKAGAEPGYGELTLLAEASENGTVTFQTTPQESEGEGFTITVLAGNDNWNADDDVTDRDCVFDLSVERIGCPCADMVALDDGEDFILYCELADGSRLAYCDSDEMFGGYDLVTAEEYPYCWQNFPEPLSNTCGLTAPGE